MGISVNKVQEGCCDSNLEAFTIIDGDSLDNIGSTCDKIIVCSDKYILVEEKSVLFAFLDNCCREVDISLDINYKFVENEVEYIDIDKIINDVVHPLNIDVKKRILSDTISNIMMTSAKKISNTTDILNKRFDSSKTNDMSTFYLYCNSGHEIDMILNMHLSSFRKNIFIECNQLVSKLGELC